MIWSFQPPEGTTASQLESGIHDMLKNYKCNTSGGTEFFCFSEAYDFPFVFDRIANMVINNDADLSWLPCEKLRAAREELIEAQQQADSELDLAYYDLDIAEEDYEKLKQDVDEKTAHLKAAQVLQFLFFWMLCCTMLLIFLLACVGQGGQSPVQSGYHENEDGKVRGRAAKIQSLIRAGAEQAYGHPRQAEEGSHQ